MSSSSGSHDNGIEVSAKTVEEAVQSAIIRLGVTEDEVIVEVLEESARGLFGIGGRDAKVRVTVIPREETFAETAKAFTDDLIAKMGLSCETLASEEEDAVKLVISGKGVGAVIGRRGETLDALQYIVNLYVNKGRHGDDYRRVILDSENYRSKREETLVRLAKSMAAKAIKYNRDLALEPMNPYERRIIHSALQNNHSVTTRSVGDDPNRKIVISPR
ncbi:DNA/RNA-binding protein [Clostridia bacterium]|nr:DNA/RNA-binding protein [Clostridia bacterium]